MQQKDGRYRTAAGEQRERLKPAFLRPTANFIPNLRNGRANELLNYSVASRKGARWDSGKRGSEREVGRLG